MFKRGDVVQHHDGEIGIYLADGVVKWLGGDIDKSKFIKPYTGPIYTKDGQRFVPSGDFRIPEVGEYIWHMNGVHHQTMGAPLTDQEHRGYKPILLPIPELEPEHGFEVGDCLQGEACGCKDVTEPLEIRLTSGGQVNFYHESNAQYLATLTNGSIKWADGVQGSIFRVRG
jgi:hypothetical protein